MNDNMKNDLSVLIDWEPSKIIDLINCSGEFSYLYEAIKKRANEFITKEEFKEIPYSRTYMALGAYFHSFMQTLPYGVSDNNYIIEALMLPKLREDLKSNIR